MTNDDLGEWLDIRAKELREELPDDCQIAVLLIKEEGEHYSFKLSTNIPHDELLYHFSQFIRRRQN